MSKVNRFSKKIGAALVMAGAFSAPTMSHHSTAAFDSNSVVVIEGEVTQVRWINPHASFKLTGDASQDHPDGLWTIEMTAPNVLINLGWKRNSLRIGDQVTVFANPSIMPSH